MQFNYIVSNPPYNGARGTKGSLHATIIINAVYHLKDGGQLLSIHPSDWRFKTNSSKQLTKLYSAHSVRATLHDTYFSRYIWNVVANVDEIILTKNYFPKLEVQFEDLSTPIVGGEFIDVTKWFSQYPVPTRHFDIFQSLVGKDDDKKLSIQKVKGSSVDYLYQKEKTNEYRYPVIQRILKEKRFSEGIYYSPIKPNGDMSRPKIILSWGSLHNMLDLNGKYNCLKEGNFFIFDENDNKKKLTELYNGINNIIFKKLLSSFMGSDQKVIVDQHFKKIKILSFFKRDFYKVIDKLTQMGDVTEDSFFYSVGQIDKSQKYKDYVFHAKIGLTWEDNKQASQQISANSVTSKGVHGIMVDKREHLAKD
jgi:hypothetical protein